MRKNDDMRKVKVVENSIAGIRCYLPAQIAAADTGRAFSSKNTETNKTFLDTSRYIVLVNFKVFKTNI